MNRKELSSSSIEREHEQKSMEIEKEYGVRLAGYIASRVVPRYKNFFIEQEILQRQGFNGAISRRNLSQTRKNLIAGFDYIKQFATSLDDSFLLEASLYSDLKDSKLGIMHEEANLFELITTSLTIQHASPTNNSYGTSLKSIRQREITGETVEFKRTSRAMGRQNFVYFVTGIGEQINAPGLHELTTYQIDLNKLALHNPQKFSQLYVSPHLTEFETNACASPCLMGNTRVDIQFDGKSQTITYRFQRSDNCLLEKTYHLHDFVFFGGNDVLTGIALRFIELLRFVGNPYRQELLTQLSDRSLSKQEKLQQLSTVMTALMPGSMVIEAKIPQEIQLNDTYTKITTPVVKDDDKDHDPYHNMNDDVYYEGDKLHLKADTTDSPFVGYLKKYAVEFLSHAGINPGDRNKNEIQEEFVELINSILTEVCFSGPYSYGMPSFSGHIPTDLNSFAFKLIYSDHELSLPLIKWLLTARFVSPTDNNLHYLFHINQRESSGTQDLFLALLSVRYKKEKHGQLLEIFYPLLNKKLFQLNFCHYVAIAAHEAFGKISESKEVAFLLEKNIPILDENDPHLHSWITFENNEKLLEYMFINQSLNINAIVHEYSWLEHAILSKNEVAAHWLLDHGAVLHRQHPEIMKVMPQSLSARLGLVTDGTHSDYQSSEPSRRDAVVIIVTSTYHNGDVYTIMGRRRVSNKLEDQWSFPGGIIEFGETPVETAIRELSEETSVKIDAEKASIRELMRVKLNDRHQSENNIGNLVFIHIDLGKTLLPSVWPDDDLGEVTKVRIHENNRSDQPVRDHKNLPIRVSNLLLFDCLTTKEPSLLPNEFSSLLFAEMYPIEFMKYFMGLLSDIEDKLSGDSSSYFTYDEVEPIKNDKPALILLKNNTINVIKECLKKISPAINNPEIKEFILISVIDSGDFSLLQFLLDNGYTTNYLQKDASCNLADLIRNRQWDMLHFIFEMVPYMGHVHKRDWKEVSKLIPSIPLVEICSHINSANADNIVYDKLMYLFKKQTNESSEQRELTLNDIRDILKRPEVMEKLTEDHIKLILLSGDVELFKKYYQLPQFEKLSYDSQYFYDFHVPPRYKTVSILKYLTDNKHTEMLAFIYEQFPDAFKWENSAYIPQHKKEASRHTKDTSRFAVGTWNQYRISDEVETMLSSDSDSFSESDDELSTTSIYQQNICLYNKKREKLTIPTQSSFKSMEIGTYKLQLEDSDGDDYRLKLFKGEVEINCLFSVSTKTALEFISLIDENNPDMVMNRLEQMGVTASEMAAMLRAEFTFQKLSC